MASEPQTPVEPPFVITKDTVVTLLNMLGVLPTTHPMALAFCRVNSIPLPTIEAPKPTIVKEEVKTVTVDEVKPKMIISTTFWVLKGPDARITKRTIESDDAVRHITTIRDKNLPPEIDNKEVCDHLICIARTYRELNAMSELLVQRRIKVRFLEFFKCGDPTDRERRRDDLQNLFSSSYYIRGVGRTECEALQISINLIQTVGPNSRDALSLNMEEINEANRHKNLQEAALKAANAERGNPPPATQNSQQPPNHWAPNNMSVRIPLRDQTSHKSRVFDSSRDSFSESPTRAPPSPFSIEYVFRRSESPTHVTPSPLSIENVFRRSESPTRAPPSPLSIENLFRRSESPTRPYSPTAGRTGEGPAPVIVEPFHYHCVPLDGRTGEAPAPVIVEPFHYHCVPLERTPQQVPAPLSNSTRIGPPKPFRIPLHYHAAQKVRVTDSSRDSTPSGSPTKRRALSHSEPKSPKKKYDKRDESSSRHSSHSRDERSKPKPHRKY